MQKIIESPSRLHKNASYMRWSRSEALKSSLRRMTQDSVKASFALMLMPLSLLLTACAAPSTVPCGQPALTPQFVPTQPLPPQSYSLSAAQLIHRWQRLATGMSPTSEPQ